ncbi:MAG: hypothetical protein A2147_11760 [Chloroflexi bacterium RBG_16_57_8]|nr:MAG: hypothetical protein A2147_11760 [Chloroflexi bacterium RBG_16_57_8]
MAAMINEEIEQSSGLLGARLSGIDRELADARARLNGLYNALETGKIALDDIGPRIRELKARQEEGAQQGESSDRG